MATKVVGLDIGSSGIKIAVLSTTLRGFELVTAGFVPYRSNDPTQEEIHDALLEVVSNIGTQGVFICALPGESATYKSTKLPFSDIRIIERALPNALEDLVPFNLEETVWDFELLNVSEEGESEVLCALTEKEEMQRFLSLFDGVGMEPRTITTPPLAYPSLYTQILQDAGELEIIADIGEKTTNLAAIRNGQIVEVKTIVWGGRNVTLALAERFNIEFERAEEGKKNEGFLPTSENPAQGEAQQIIGETISEAVDPLIKEIVFFAELAQVKANSKLSRIRLTGGGSKIRNLSAYIEERTGLACERLHLLSDDFNKLPEPFDEDLLALPLALATYGMGHKGKLINLRKGEFAYAGEFQYYQKQIVQVLIGLAVILLFALINVGTASWALGHEEDALKAQLAKITKRVIGKPIGNVKRAKAIINETIGGKIGDEELPIPELPATVIIAEIGNRLQASGVAAYLKEISIKVVRKKISIVIKGITDTIPSVGRIEEALSAYPCFKKVTPGATRTTVSGTKIEFSFEIEVGCENGMTPEEASQKASEADAAREPANPQMPTTPATKPADTEEEAVPIVPPPTGTVVPNGGSMKLDPTKGSPHRGVR